MTKPYKERVDKGVRRTVYVSVICPCGKVFEVRKARYEAGRGRRCSKECQYKYAERPSGLVYEKHKENPTSFKPGEHKSVETEFKPGQKPWNEGVKGTHFSPETEFKPGSMKPANPYRPTSPEYELLHQRVAAKNGRAAEHSCAHKDATCNGRMEWANISREYRNEEDFMPLCRSHHCRYDDVGKLED